MRDGSTSYLSVISNYDAMKYVLSLGCLKLAQIRWSNPEAGGLIVAASVEHARKIQQILINDFGQTTVIVTYRDDEPLKKIEQYRHSSTQWIVSVGMVSEGTDIPRLQVCFHLSSIKTELYFRQVLGRILRITNSLNQEAWLYTIAEERLAKFAERVGDEGYGLICESEEPEVCFNMDSVLLYDCPKTGNRGDVVVSGTQWSLCIEGGTNEVDSVSFQLKLERFRNRLVEAFGEGNEI